VGVMRRWALIVLTGLVALMAWIGARQLMFGPDPALPLDPPDWLPGGWTTGGAALALVVGAPMTVSWLLLLARAPAGRTCAFFSGAALVVWTVVQVALIGYALLLQPVMLLVGIAIAALGWPLWGSPTGRDGP